MFQHWTTSAYVTPIVNINRFLASLT